VARTEIAGRILHYRANLGSPEELNRRDPSYNHPVHMARPFYSTVETLCIVVLTGAPHMGIGL
jgi:hypothetical protein